MVLEMNITYSTSFVLSIIWELLFKSPIKWHKKWQGNNIICHIPGKGFLKILLNGCFYDEISHIANSHVIYVSLDLIRKYLPIPECSQMKMMPSYFKAKM